MNSSIEKQRIDHLYAARLLLLQLRRTGDAWSDGRVVHRGVELTRLRQDTLARIVQLKEKNPSKRRRPEMLRITKNLVSSPGYLGQEDGETVGAWLVRLLSRYVKAGDHGSTERAKVARRILRRKFPEYAEMLAPEHRYNHREMTFIARGRAAYRWKTAHPINIEGFGITINEGVSAIPTHLGFSVEVGDRLFEVPVQDVRKCGRMPVWQDDKRHTAV